MSTVCEDPELHSSAQTFEAVAALAMEAMAEVEAGEREDVLAALVTEEVDGRPLTMEERLGIVTTLLLGVSTRPAA